MLILTSGEVQIIAGIMFALLSRTFFDQTGKPKIGDPQLTIIEHQDVGWFEITICFAHTTTGAEKIIKWRVDALNLRPAAGNIFPTLGLHMVKVVRVPIVGPESVFLLRLFGLLGGIRSSKTYRRSRKRQPINLF